RGNRPVKRRRRTFQIYCVRRVRPARNPPPFSSRTIIFRRHMSRDFRRGKKLRKIVVVFPPGRKPVLELLRLRIDGALPLRNEALPLPLDPQKAPRRNFPGARFPRQVPPVAPDQPTEGQRTARPFPRSPSSIHHEGARDRMPAPSQLGVTRRPRASAQLHLETLEPRCLLAANPWIAGVLVPEPENNNTLDKPHSLGPLQPMSVAGVISNASAGGADVDWYSFTLTPPTSV